MAGLLAYEPGWQRLHNWTNYSSGKSVVSSGGGMVARFQLTPSALKLISEVGVTLEPWEAHWEREKGASPAAPRNVALVILRGRKGIRFAGVKQRGPDLPVNLSDPRVVAMVEDLRAHNAFVLHHGLEGVDFVGLRRVFTDGDQPGFNWQWHGRFYSVPGAGEAYENLGGPERRRRLRLGGQAVGEVDIRASHLTLLYALRGLPFSPVADPYSVPGLDRELVKRWITQALGKDSMLAKSWSHNARQYFSEVQPGAKLQREIPLADFKHQVLTHHPLLRDLGQPGVPSSAELTFQESEVLRQAMESLRLQGIPSLPVHDSLIVPVEQLEGAAAAVRKAFKRQVEIVLGRGSPVTPSVQLKYPNQ